MADFISTYLNTQDIFSTRHIGPDAHEQAKMLKALGVASLDELIEQTIPNGIRLKNALDLPEALSEKDFLAMLHTTAAKNKIFRSYIGMGYYDTVVPPVILRNLLENPGWYTQYTPYQAEIAQGRLESLLNFQTMVCDLTGFAIANASLLDEGTAAAEAMHLMFAAHHKSGSEANVLFVSENVYPQTLDVVKTRAVPLDIEVVVGDHTTFEWNEKVFGAIVQYPAGDGTLYDYRSFCEEAHKHGAMVTVACDLMALALLTPPSEFGADIAVGNSQRFGVPLGYGGPHAAFFATKDEYKRIMPGRIIGLSIDAQGNPAFRMALQTREQHIRRDKATSNICTAQALLANMAAMYAVYHGPKGIRRIAERIHASALLLAEGLKSIGFTVSANEFFDTIRVELDNVAQDAIRKQATEHQINFRYFENGAVGISMDETVSPSDIEEILSVFAHAGVSKNGKKIDLKALSHELSMQYSETFARKSEYMTHPVFNKHHSETEMLRYLKHLENKDLSLAHSMIPLGSCTMKLNATTEMIPVSWKAFSQLHPFAPLDQTKGYQEVFDGLEKALCEITGFAAVSLQPNAGAQGEYAGLLVIRKYQESRGEAHRDVVIIPASAHGTNPASAVMAGMKVVVSKTDAKGNIDLDDLRQKAIENKDRLSALMVTYPSTHGVFEEHIREICQVIHENGGQVYMDGANMNAQVGLTSPANIGADVCHLNLHKTFCIPHGGGGPGMGPIGVAKHLAPFLMGHAVVPIGSDQALGAISAAPWGSASILLISWAYICMMGGEGLTQATKIAILNANYIKSRLEKHFPILYQGIHGRVAHEMIVDMRKFKQSAGIEVEDIAKRLIDYGFHAPTVSFPVAGTLMIEPTESESLDEIDRFCDALIAIGEEIKEIESGKADKTDNVLKNAPHTMLVATADEWNHKYTREQAAYPAPWLRENKFWSTVGRVNNAHGDRQLICTCPPIEAYEAPTSLEKQAELV